MKTAPRITPERLRRSCRSAFNPVRHLTPESLARQLDAFHAGRLAEAARLWEVIEQRDDVVKAVATKRKKAPGRFGWDVVADDDSLAAQRHQAALTAFYRDLDATHAADRNERGGLSLLLRQMMDAIGKRYAVHEIVWRPGKADDGAPRLSASFRFVPLWFFENRDGELRFLPADAASRGLPLRDGEWLVTTGDGLMEATAIAYLFKHLPLRDWLVYCERNGMPGVRGITDAEPGSAEWDAAREAVQAFGAEFHAIMSRGTDIEAIDLSASGQLPYPQLIDRMDKAIATLWRGSSMGTIADGGAGISLQGKETALIEREDVAHLSGTLHAQVNRHVTRHLFGEEPRARLVIRHKESGIGAEEMETVRDAIIESIPAAIESLLRRFIPTPTA